ncbi:hypothetical protein GCM10007853_07450 [Algimonas ampicilliniresistens]|uniref:Uncharacterized protein n=1 Tax=Algimonas ampicilliniresistens TaxID=1298735 RepID=A0ABQ5V5R4_9PROT|nr:hypothetical protein [Algimonas ampicilliniresistens]GLQ22871.1 hypothetical protein GCM10007853_07450 [Algimonas ampicilliniresistens]
MKRLALALTVLLAIAITYVALMAWRSPPTYDLNTDYVDYPLLSWDAYEAISHTVEPPIIRQTSAGTGEALIFGATHSSDPTHPQFAELNHQFDSFKPDIVLVEGRMGFVLPPFMDPVQSFGESGALAAMAKRDGLALYTWELCRACEPEQLRKRFSDRQVALYLLLRPYSGSKGVSPEAARDRMSSIIADRGKRPGIKGVIDDIGAFDAAWSVEFPDGESWHAMQGVHASPGFLNDMFEYGNDIRDQHLLNVIRTLTEDGKRVMATVGWSHAIRIEPALKILESEAR